MTDYKWLKEHDWVVTEKLTSIQLQHIIILCQSCDMVIDKGLMVRLTEVGTLAYYIGYGKNSMAGPEEGTVVIQVGIYGGRDIIVTYNDIVEAATQIRKSKSLTDVT